MDARPIGRILRFIPQTAVQILARARVHPNFLSALGLVASLSAVVSFAVGRFAPAGAAILVAGALDWLDGAVARAQGRATNFGAFLDSSLDCYADLALFVGLLVYYARVNRFLYAVLVCFALAGSVMIGYTRARSASLVAHGQPQPVAGLDRGFWERPERLGLMILGALTNRMAAVLWLLAIGPNLSVVATILRARLKIRLLAKQQPAAESSPGS